MSEAGQKSSSYDAIHQDLVLTSKERDDLMAANQFLEKKLTETSQILGVIEEGRRADQNELKKVREQLQVF
jgi:hypothetical protein